MLRTVGTATLPYSGRIRARDHNSRGVWFAPGSSNSPRPTPSARLLLIPMLMRSPREHIQLLAPLEGALDLVHEWLVNIARGENPELDLRNLRAVLLNLRELAEADSNITEAVDEVFEAALAYQGEFAHAAKARTDAAYHFLLLSAARMERSLAALRSVLRNAKPSASRRRPGELR
jgi:hypothetical protein